MRNKMKTMLLLFLFSAVGFCVPAYALDSDLSYHYKNRESGRVCHCGKIQYQHPRGDTRLSQGYL